MAHPRRQGTFGPPSDQVTTKTSGQLQKWHAQTQIRSQFGISRGGTFAKSIVMYRDSAGGYTAWAVLPAYAEMGGY